MPSKAHAALALLLVPLAAVAHEGASGVVKERMDAMGEIAAAMKTLGRMFQRARPYDGDAAAAAALTIHGHAGERMTALFPEGSLDQPSEALPDIWDDWDTFRRLAGQTARFSAVLADAAGNPPSDGPLRLRDITFADADPGALAAGPPDHAFSYLAKTCVACHARFRQSND